MSRGVEPRNPLVNAPLGEAMPESCAEDRDSRSAAEQDEHDRWLCENVPPHHH
jgi:hypothetical protein